MSLVDPAGVPVRGKMYRREGEWRLLIYGPSWAVSEFAMEASKKGARVHGWGGSSGAEEGNMLLGSRRRKVFNTDTKGG